MPPNRAALVYKRDCRFCCVSAAGVLRWDRTAALRPVALGTPEADQLLASLPADARDASWHLVEPDGTVTSAGAAAPVLLRRLPGGRPFAVLLGSSPSATERLYRFVAENRSHLGRLLSERSVARARALIDRRS